MNGPMNGPMTGPATRPRQTKNPIEQQAGNPAERTARRALGRHPAEAARPQTAASFSSPVRIRITRSTSDTKILPSPILPVRAAPITASIT
ncbi:Uncharacterised protein [Burkholderia pseudomallei]|nr:hypothetical protein BG24_125 [Burkholderia pseudomallei PB08298010]CAJ3048476.1 Uncharacterised protein [Burkholderia pseudomallei]CAJ4333646.1 PilL protein [Burkholderia pseudomallei]CAJ4605667.1 PilL protein [Burkholderia pseudomallei]CAJ4892271.1 PilL protein [Burkholderia pseudomallei]